jgi:hypothetical protein
MKKLVLILCLLAQPALAGNGYYVATTGTDGGAGTSGDPWSMIKACTTTTVVAGDTVYIKPGTYTTAYYSYEYSPEFIMKPTQSGTSGNRITWRNVPGSARPIIRGNTTLHYSGIELTGNSYLTFDSLNVRNCWRRGFQASGSSDIIIRNCLIDSVGIGDNPGANPGGISSPANQADNLEIYNNHFGWCVNSGVHAEMGIDSCAIYNNTFEGCRAGIFLKTTTSGYRQMDWHIYNNTIFNDGTGPLSAVTGIKWMGGYTYRNIFIHHNVVYGTGWDAADAAAFTIGLTDGICDDTTIHHYMYVYNNTVDCENETFAFLRMEQCDKNSSSVPLYDTSGFFNNIILNAVPYTETTDGIVSNYGYDCAVSGIGNVGSEWDFDYNLIYDTSSSDLFMWTVNGAARDTFTHAEWISNLGYSANDTLDEPDFVDQASRDYRIYNTSPGATGGHGGYVDTRGGDSILLPSYMGAFEPIGQVGHKVKGVKTIRGVKRIGDANGYQTDTQWATVDRRVARRHYHAGAYPPACSQ